MKNIASLLFLLLVALLIWALTGFSQDFTTVGTLIGGTWGAIGLYLSTAKALDERFSRDPSRSPLKAVLDTTKPLVVQIAPPASEPSLPVDKAERLKKIRTLPAPVTREQATEDAAALLGDRTDLFWSEVGANPNGILALLAKDGFWLEGLILVFEQNHGSFPKNEARVLAQVLSQQWTPEKLNIGKEVPLPMLQEQLGKMAERNYPNLRYPRSREGYVGHLYPYSDYEQLLVELGDVPASFKFSLASLLWLPLFRLFRKDPRTFFDGLWRLPRPWNSIITTLLYILFAPLDALKSALVYPFAWLERRLKRAATYYDNPTPAREALEQFWHKTYLPVKMRLWRLADRFNIPRNHKLHRADGLIQAARKAGILDTDGQELWFTQEYWRDYFTATRLVDLDALEYFLRRNGASNPKRLMRGEQVAIMACGLSSVPAESLARVLARDASAAARCFLTLVDSPPSVPLQWRDKILDALVQALKTAQSEGNSWFCVDSMRSLRSLTDEPRYASVSLAKLPEIEVDEAKVEAAKVIGSYDWHVYELLEAALQTMDANHTRHVLIALGALQDKRAVKLLRNQMEASQDLHTRMVAAIVLATYYHDAPGSAALEKYLRAEMPENEYRSPWTYLDVAGEDAIAFTLGVLERASVPPKDWNVHDPFRGMTDPLLAKLEMYYQDNPRVEAMLLEILSRTDQPRLMQFLVEALGKIKSRQSVPVLIKLLRHDDDYLRGLVVRALRQIDSPAVAAELTGLLYSSNLRLVSNVMWAIGALGNADTIRTLIEKVDSPDVEKYAYETGDPGMPIALTAVGVLVKLGNEIRESKAATEKQKADAWSYLNLAAEWCKAHLDDRRPIRGGYKTVSERVLNYLDHEIPMEKAHQYYADWVREHPEDQI